MEIFTGHTGTNHVTAEIFRAMLFGLFGKTSVILPVWEKFSYVLESNNSILIKRGMLYHNGNLSCTTKKTGDRVTIENGTQGMKRIDLIVNRYKKVELTGIESNEWVVLKGTPHPTDAGIPEFNKGNLMDGALIDDCPVFAVHLNGLNIESVICTIPTLSNFGDLKSGAFADIANNLTTSKAGSALDASRGKELADSIKATNQNVANLGENIKKLDAKIDNSNVPEQLLSSRTINEGEVIQLPWTSKHNLKVMLNVSGTGVCCEIPKSIRTGHRAVNYFGGGTAIIVDFKLVSDTQLEIVRIWKDGAWKSYSVQMEIWAV